MRTADVWTVVLIAAVVGMLGAVVLARKGGNAETEMGRRWDDVGWITSPIERPIVFAFVLAGKLNREVRTKYFRRDDFSGGATIVGPYRDQGNTGEHSGATVLFVANPFHGVDLVQFVTTNHDLDSEAGKAEFVDDGDPAVMDAEAWRRVGRFVQRYPLKRDEVLRFTKHWIFINNINGVGPYRAIATLCYLHDLASAVQGKAPTGTEHAMVAHNAGRIDGIPWRRRTQYGEATQPLGPDVLRGLANGPTTAGR